MAATKIKVIELAKELGVTSKDLMVAAEEMGHKGVRAMTPLDQTLANELRVKLGKGRELPEETSKPKRASKPRAAAADGVAKPASRGRKATVEEGAEDGSEIRPAATIVRPKPAVPSEVAAEPPMVVGRSAAEIAPEPPKIAPAAPVGPPCFISGGTDLASENQP